MPVMPVSNFFTVNNLGFWHYGMEEVIGSIPIRSTKQPLNNQLVMSCIVSSERVREGVEGC
jgi:hypothetical protein